jgi:hypothetical protein
VPAYSVKSLDFIVEYSIVECISQLLLFSKLELLFSIVEHYQ